MRSFHLDLNLIYDLFDSHKHFFRLNKHLFDGQANENKNNIIINFLSFSTFQIILIIFLIIFIFYNKIN